MRTIADEATAFDAGLLAAQGLAELAPVSGFTPSYPETRIGLFHFSAATRTEPLGYVTSSAQRACCVSWPEVAMDLFLYTQADPLLNPTDSGSTYLYAAANPLSNTDPTGEALRYGHYCGRGQDPGRQKPFDTIDAACQVHDDCYQKANVDWTWFPPNPNKPKNYAKVCAQFACDSALCSFAVGYEASAKTQKQKTVVALIRQEFCHLSVCPACPAPSPEPTPTPNPNPIWYK